MRMQAQRSEQGMIVYFRSKKVNSLKQYWQRGKHDGEIDGKIVDRHFFCEDIGLIRHAVARNEAQHAWHLCVKNENRI